VMCAQEQMIPAADSWAVVTKIWYHVC
jgi:hypothetical protein